jgi:hypothetical protein
VLIAALVLLGIILLFLSLPVDVELCLRIRGRADFGLRIKYLFGLAQWAGREGSRARAKHMANSTKQAGGSMTPRLWDAAQVDGVWNSIWQLLKRLTGQVRIRRIEADLRVSLGDDYYTGMLAGLLMPLVILLNGLAEGDKTVRPVFEEDLLLDGFLKADLRLRPVGVIIPCLAFISSAPVQRARRILTGHR